MELKSYGKMNIKTLKKFIGRKNPYAIQILIGKNKCMYKPIHEEFTDKLLQEHLDGIKSLGTYVIKEDGMVNFGTIDIDIDEITPETLKEAKELGEQIYELFPDFKRCLEYSGRRGFHVWVFMENPEPPAFVRELIKTRLTMVGIKNVEVFPKQDSLLGKKLGNLIKLPCGKHKLGWWSYIIKEVK